jgi:hypothetical protein
MGLQEKTHNLSTVADQVSQIVADETSTLSRTESQETSEIQGV